jgi:RNA polymerase sigma factor (sigma-70 family)
MMATISGTELLSQNQNTLNGSSSTPEFRCSASESHLIRCVNEGNAEAFYELVRPYERAVYLAALSIVKNEADAEEVAQEAVLKALKGLSRFRQEAKFSTWLIQITINEARMKSRKDRHHLYESMDEGQQNDEGDYIPKDFADWREIPSEALEQRELREALIKALESLPENEKKIALTPTGLLMEGAFPKKRRQEYKSVKTQLFANYSSGLEQSLIRRGSRSSGIERRKGDDSGRD